jgi:hypothetical protein
MEFDDREADWKAHGAPTEIEIKLDREDDWSEVSGSKKARKQWQMVNMNMRVKKKNRSLAWGLSAAITMKCCSDMLENDSNHHDMGSEDEGKWGGLSTMQCEQIPHLHYDPDSKSLPVTTQAALVVTFTIMMMAGDYVAQVIDVKRAFLKGSLHQRMKFYYWKCLKALNGFLII